MKIGVVGAGFSGLAAAYNLTKKGHNVRIFEKEAKPGGLALGFKDKKWDWQLEEHYHHWFVTDWAARELAEDIGHEIVFKKPTTSVWCHDEIFQLDSPQNLVTFPHLPLLDRFRTGIILGYLKLTPYWKNLEKIAAKDFIIRFMGRRSWEVLWEPLFIGKFGKKAYDLPASWYWARIKKRSSALGYPTGGFQAFADSVEQKIINNGGSISYGSTVEKITKDNDDFNLHVSGKTHKFDKIIFTLPFSLLLQIVKGLPVEYKRSIRPLGSVGAVNLVLATKKQFLNDGTYWLNINDKKMPFLAVVEHTNFINNSHYNGDHIVYIGNYVPTEHEYFNKSADQLVNLFVNDLKKINPKFKKSDIRKSWVFKAPYAQPIVPLNYSRLVPSIKTPVEGLFVANMQQVYPWDRGTNYAIEVGYNAAELLIQDMNNR